MPPFSSFLNTPNQTSTSPASMPSSSTSRRLSNESFSFSWLADVDNSSFEIGPYVVSRAHRSSTSDAYEFDFGLSRPLSPVLVHADQIFSNGFLLPLRLVDPSKSESTTASESSSDVSTLSRSLSLDSSESYISFSNRYRPQHPGCRDATGRRLASLEGSPLFPTSSTGGTKPSAKLPFLMSCARKYLCLSFLLPWSKKARRLRLRLSKPKMEITAPLTTGGGGDDDDSTALRCRGRRISDNSYESAIDEAILHCKKSVLST